MSDAKHTPGPWHVADNGDDVRDAEERNVFLDVDRDEWPANARLIAAAPELLAALLNMVECFDDDRSFHTPARTRAIILACAALAKVNAT